MQKIILMMFCLLSLLACHSVKKVEDNKKNSGQLNSLTEVIQYHSSLPLSKELSIILNDDNSSDLKSRIFSKLYDYLHHGFEISEKCRIMAESSIEEDLIVASYPKISNCVESFYFSRDYQYQIKLLFDLYNHEELLGEDDRDKIDLLYEIDHKTGNNMMYITKVSSLVIAKTAFSVIKQISDSEQDVTKKKDYESSLALALESVKKAENNLLRVKNLINQ